MRAQKSAKTSPSTCEVCVPVVLSVVPSSHRAFPFISPPHPTFPPIVPSHPSHLLWDVLTVRFS